MISRVTDGDTFRLVGVERAIRIWGLDAPERNEIGGSRATETMRHLVEGQMVTCEVVDFDRYGRIVGHCFLPDGTDVAGEMIRLGVAREYCRYSRGYYRTC
jgi:endonuclease YncB( thermonuclease family)